MTWGKVPIAEIRERQGRRLHQFLSRKVYPYCPYYRQLFDSIGLKPDQVRSIDDLRRIPFTSKADLAPTPERPDRYRDFILQPSPEQIADDLTITDKIALFAKSKLYLRTIQDQVLDEYLPVHTTFTTGRSAALTALFNSAARVSSPAHPGRRRRCPRLP